jgi:hypothetical protein
MLRLMGRRQTARVGFRSLCLAIVFSTAACSDDPAEASGTRWSLVFENLDAALISVTGRAADDVWTVGADSGDGPLILHFDGSSWKRSRVAEAAHLWWVHLADESTVVCGGSDGTILQGNLEAGFERQATPGSSTVYGLFGTPGDLWAVGGDADVTPGFVWRNQGDGWVDVTSQISAEPLPPVFKVWGTARDDIWFVGMDGLAIHWDGVGFEIVDSGTSRRLFTVHGTGQAPAAFAAVGGFGSAVIVEYDGAAWRDVTPAEPPNMLFGVSMTSGEHGYAVGDDGTVVSRSARGWADEITGFRIANPFHSVWTDPGGGVWAVGGDVLTPALNRGMLLHGDPSGNGPGISNQIED